jgi:hypothetical protein
LRGIFIGDDKEIAGSPGPRRIADRGFTNDGDENEIAGPAVAINLADERTVGGVGGDDDIGLGAAQEVAQGFAQRHGAGLERMAQPFT